MNFCSNNIKNKNSFLQTHTHLQIPFVPVVKQKTFGSIANNHGKVMKFYPKPTPSQDKVLFKSKSKRKNLDYQPQTFKIKVQTSEKSKGHNHYFNKLQASTIVPFQKLKQMTLSSATTSLNIDSNSRKIQFPEQNISLSWQDIRRKKYEGLLKKFVINCNPSINYSSNFCQCEYPCKYATKWNKWAKQSKNTLYKMLRQETLSKQADIQIKKDIKRTQPENVSFQQPHNLQKLQQILEMYCKYDKSIQYIQGMNMIASVVLYHVKDTQRSFWVFVDLMQNREFGEIYMNGFKMLNKHIKIVNKLVEVKVHDLHIFLKELEVELDPILIGWFLSLMLRVIPLESGHLMIDQFIKEGFLALYRVILAYLIYLKEELFARGDSSDVLTRLSASCKQNSDWQQIIQASHSININNSEVWQIVRNL